MSVNRNKNRLLSPKLTEAIYKLAALSRLGGLNTLPIFVSLREVPPSAKTRASEMGIQVIAGQADMIGLKAKLKP